ncbi:hypothetical protein [Saccharopolyspora spinosa]|uniref:hypothetical protein n=1 Tax=Saccharopolyspora spinosa TaxID=60894 RepID=UPI000237B4C9|nr:hypothetical protein [Saccharopolyspora spinosa]
MERRYRRWEWTKNRLTELEDTALDDDDEQMAEWAMRLLFDFEDARSVVVRGPVESQARLNAVVLTPFVTRIAERFGGGWREVAAEIGLGDGTGLPADFEQSLENLAELYWETDPDLYEFYNALPGMRRLRLLIDVGFDDGREGAAFYKRKVDDLRTLAAELSGLVVNPQAGQQELRSTAEIRRWLGRMDLVHDLGGVGAVVGEIGADLVSGRRLLPVIRMAEELYGKRVGVERLRGLAWLANQFDPQSSNISQASLARMAAGFEGRADGHASPSDVRRLVELAGSGREFLGQVDGDPKRALEAIWNADKAWRRMGDRLRVLEATARVKHDEQLAEWAWGLLTELDDARSVVVGEPAESQARLNAVVLPSFVTKIAERFGGGWREVAAEIGLGDGTVIDAGFDDGRQGADFYARTVDDLRSLVADLPDNPQTGQHEPRSPVAVGAAEIRRWLERMDLVHDLGGAGAVVGEVGADLLGGRRLFPVIELAEHLYGKRPGTEMLRGLAWLANQFDPQSSNISQASLARMAAGFEGRADGHASPSDVRRLVELAGSGREFLGQVDGDPKRALEAIWNADKAWRRMGDRLRVLEATARVKHDEQLAEWAWGLLTELDDARSVVVGEPAESQARLNAGVLPSFVTKIAERFGGGWREVAAEIGLGDGTGLPADFEQSLLNLAELYWEVDPDLSRFDKAPLWLRRIRVLIDAGFDDGRQGADFYARTVDDLRSLVADLPDNPQTGQHEPRSPGSARTWWVVGGCSRLYGWQSSCTTRRQTWKCSTVWRGWRTSLIPCRRTFRCRTSPT